MRPTLPVPPELAGYSWRPLRSTDAPALQRLELACAQADDNPRPRSSQQIEQLLAGFAADLEHNTLCAVQAGDDLIASTSIAFDDRLPQEYRAFLEYYLHPAHRSQQLHDFLLDWLETCAHQIFAGSEDTRPLVMRLDGYQQNSELFARYEQHGFQFAMAEDEMHCDLAQPIPDPLLPDNMRFVPWTAERAPLFFQVYQLAFRERPGFPGWTEAIWRHTLTNHDDFRADLSLLLMDGETAVAYAICSVEPESGASGHIAQIGVHPRWRQRGLAGELLAELMRRFRAEGLRQATLEVNANNPQATSVYLRLGFQRSNRYTSYRKTVLTKA